MSTQALILLMFAPFEIIYSTVTRHYRDKEIKIVKKKFGDLDRPLSLIRRHPGLTFLTPRRELLLRDGARLAMISARRWCGLMRMNTSACRAE